MSEIGISVDPGNNRDALSFSVELDGTDPSAWFELRFPSVYLVTVRRTDDEAGDFDIGLEWRHPGGARVHEASLTGGDGEWTLEYLAGPCDVRVTSGDAQDVTVLLREAAGHGMQGRG